jgi:NAD-dependent SIR2 family protein deacetylase
MALLGASQHIDELQREEADSQKNMIELQGELLKCKDTQISGMQQTVQSEIRNLKSEVTDTVK